MHTLALCLALLGADKPEDFVMPPAGVVISPAKPGDPPPEITIPYPADLANSLAAINRRIDALATQVELLRLYRAAPTLSDGHPLIDKAAPCPSASRCSKPGECGEAGGECKTVAKVARPKQWITLNNRPGWQGYGVLDDAGKVVPEAWRQIPAAQPAPAYYQPAYQPYQAPSCSGGSCYRR